MRAGIVERIEQQAERARAGQPARIRMKVNNLVDEQVVDALYRAARAGVPIDCVVRSICALRPGVPGLSETVRVRSILGRYLEHSRLFAFGEEPEAQWWLGSADIMHRNLDRRVETLVRVSDPLLTDQLAGTFARAMDPATTSWHLDADGGWTRRGETDLHAAVAQQMSERHG
jgi:polyphosphate kinase